MKRRTLLKTTGIAAGVLSTTGAGVVAGSGPGNGGGSNGNGGRIQKADDFLPLSEEELLSLSNEDVQRPFNPAIGGGDAYDPDAFEGADGYPHGGRVTSDDADYVATNRSELQDALDQASSGDVVWIPGDETIDATGPAEDNTYYGNTPFVVPAGVTVASDRGQDGSKGAKLTKTRPDVAATFRVVADDVRITGLRLIGPEPEFYTKDDRGVDSIYGVGVSMGVWIEGPSDYGADTVSGDTEGVENVEVDNCHFSGFIYNCIRVNGFSWIGSPPLENVYIHHNEMVDTPSPGLGYGVNVMANANPLVEYNYFDNNRHATAGSGTVGCGYTARSNLFGPRTRGHVIDMHGSGGSAGVELVVEDNVVLATESPYDAPDPIEQGVQESVKIRAAPEEQAVIRGNWFFNDRIPGLGDKRGAGEWGDVIRQVGTGSDEFVDLVHYNNLYGKVHPVAAHGPDDTEWLPNQANKS